MIQVKVKCFSQVQYALGVNELSLELEPGTTSAELEELVRNTAQGKLDGVILRIAVNQKYVPVEIELKDGDEIAFIPPVQGG
ncbi:MAG TPA: MoaD/ThiS family protein [Candidatus Marinimicrobia bacterium]|jgi:molybdopterin converting factor subunit 1|nr:molybdopterin synthase sulfur carrier subunit [Candidatus Neomarinimicrobiota bacterium]MDP6276592.1 MoaD/ThiS family protein [Candidatus Neomarinimicrobiota bacterium]MDP7216976.1 MoaD/ThiS family protein [Candidatus Neomarinimicrobiota bacterium]HBN45484.1 MoaD/ThiS family protein [Candidatus Neomarinimicrobiota bacterium]HJL74893.1 MoaD/ThiS family protein [Candidatus Neomarinimicrobiota bacterium]|tara:strand:- start:4871 stop:5116 length:246 start_codon:yes stop_codon:yes gene_type:complete